MAYIGNRPVSGDNNSFRVLDDIKTHTFSFDGSSSSVVSTSDNTITHLGHRLIQGQRVTYTDGTGSPIGGLTDGTVYFVVINDANSFKLASSASNAAAGTGINLTSVGSGTSHNITVAFDGVNTKFKATFNNGKEADVTRVAQIQISLNNVIQQPQNTATPTSGFGFDTDSVIVFATAPASNATFWGILFANNFPTFEISDNDVDSFTGDGSATEFSLSKSPATNENIIVTIDGVVQYPSDNSTTRAYNTVGNALQFSSAPADGADIQARHIGFAGPDPSVAGVTAFYGRTGSVFLNSSDSIVVNDAEVTGNLTVQGTMTTLDTKVTEVDQLEVAADNTTVGVAITQSGSGDILNLYDGSTEIFSVEDGGDIISKGQYLKIQNAASPEIQLTDTSASDSLCFIRNSSGNLRLAADNNNVHSDTSLMFLVDGDEAMRIKGGNLGINSTSPTEKLDVIGNIKASGTITASSFVGGLPITNGADNRVITATSASAIQGEAGLTFDGSTLNNAGSGFKEISVSSSTNNSATLRLLNNQKNFSVSNVTGGKFAIADGSTQRFVIDGSGNIGVGTNNPIQKVQINNGADDPNIVLLYGADTSTEYAGIGVFQGNATFTGGGAGSNNTGISLRTASGGTEIERVHITSTGVIQLSNLYSPYTPGTATRFSLYNDTNNHYGLHVGGSYDLNYNAGGSTLSGKGEHRFHTAATERLRITSDGEVRIADGGLLTINADASGNYAVSEALRVDDNNSTNDRALQIFEYHNNGSRWHSFNQNLNVTTTGSSYTYTQGNYGGSTMMQMLNGNLRIFNNPEVVGGGTSAITPIERFTILSGGNVGINSINPSTPLEIYSAASQGWKFKIKTSVSEGAGFYQRSNGDFELVLRDASNNNNHIAGTDGALQFKTSGSEKLRITGIGSVGIGIANPTQKFQMVGGNIRLDKGRRLDFGDQFRTLQYTSNDTMTLQSPENVVICIDNNANETDRIFAIKKDTQNPDDGSGTELFRVQEDGSIGVNIASPDGQFHIHNSTAGSVTAATDANDLVIESSANVGMSFLTANDSLARIKFGDPDATNAGALVYNHQNDKISIVTGTANRMIIGSDMISARTHYGVARTAGGYTFRETNEGGERAGMHSDASNHLIFKAGGANEYVRISHQGNVGIGTNDPDAKLNVYRDDAGLGHQIQISQDGTGDATLGFEIVGTRAWSMGIDNSDGDKFKIASGSAVDGSADSNSRLTISTTGNVGIGTSDPDQKLHVVVTSATATAAKFERSHNNNVAIEYRNTIGNMYAGLAGNALGWAIDDDANLGVAPMFIVRRDTSRVGIGSLIPADRFDVHGNAIFGEQSTADGQVQIGRRYSGNRNAYVDLIGDDTYHDYGLRVIRKSDGENAESQIDHRGTGDFTVSATEAATIRFAITGSERLRITSDGHVKIPDNAEIRLGGAQTTSGVIKIYSQSGTSDMTHIDATSGNGKHMRFIDSSSGTTQTELYHGNAQKLSTQSYGILVQGQVGGTTGFLTNDAGDIEIGTRSRIHAASGTCFIVENSNSGGDEVFRIKSDGKVGIGTADPLVRLNVDNPTALGGTSGNRQEIARFEGNVANNGILEFSNMRISNGSDWESSAFRIQRIIDVTRMGYIDFGTGAGSGTGGDGRNIQFGSGDGTLMMHLDSEGKVGIGTAAPVKELDIVGDAAIEGTLFLSDVGGQIVKLIGTGGNLDVHSDGTIDFIESDNNKTMVTFDINTTHNDARIYMEGDIDTYWNHPASNEFGFTMGGNELLRLTSSIARIKGFNGTGLRLEGSGSDYQGMQLKVTDASASQTRNIFIDVVNENGKAVANQVGQIQSDGGSKWSWATQPPGTSRTADNARQDRLHITANGSIGINQPDPTASLEVRPANGTGLGETAGDELDIAEFGSGTNATGGANDVKLLVQNVRLSDGNNWTTTTTRIQRRVDVTDQSYIDFGTGGGADGGDIELGYGSRVNVHIDNAGGVGIASVSSNDGCGVIKYMSGTSRPDNAVGGITVRVDAGDITGDIKIPRFGHIMAVTSFTDNAGTNYPQPSGAGLIYVDVGPSKSLAVITSNNVSGNLRTSDSMVTDITTLTNNNVTFMPGSTNGTIRIANRWTTSPTSSKITFYLTFM